MTVVPHFLLKRLYVAGSLRCTDEGVCFDIKNVLGPGMLTRLSHIRIGDNDYEPENVTLHHEDQNLKATDISEDNPLHVLMNQTVTVVINGATLEAGEYPVEIEVVSREAGKVTLSVTDEIA